VTSQTAESRLTINREKLRDQGSLLGDDQSVLRNTNSLCHNFGSGHIACLILDERNRNMLRAAIIFFIIGLIAMFFGMNGVAGLSVELGKTLLYVFLVLAVISFVISLATGRRAGPPLP
jgi:uncharacterized membrane protein YtjA (UPF0391 family)